MLQRRINFKNHENYLNQQNENYYKVRYYTYIGIGEKTHNQLLHLAVGR